MTTYFERVHEDAILPERKTKGAAGYDIHAYKSGEIAPRKTVMVETGIKCHMDNKTHLQVHLRSSVGVKNDVMLACGVGIIDSDYDEQIYIPIRNLGDKPFKYQAGERLAQGVFVPYIKTDNDSVTADRVGGFGSTGK